MMEQLSIQQVSKVYKRNKIVANDRISADFFPGEIVAITGHNGAGKSTLLNQIIGITKPSSGEITYKNHSLIRERKRTRQVVSMMPQFHAPLTGVTIRQAIQSILSVRGLNKKQIVEETDKILSELQIEDWSDQQGQNLSGGLQRLTSFAMSVAAPPPILLLDEPTNDVDPVRRKIIWKHLRKLANEGHIVAVVTHNLLEVEQFSDRYLILNKGIIIKDTYVREDKEQEKDISKLIIYVKKKLADHIFPQEFSYEFIDDELRYEILLNNDQIDFAIRWLVLQRQKKVIVDYKLAPVSLNDIYGGLTHE